jgi:hypothetical protein
MKAAAWADALDLKNAGAALFEPDLDHLSLEAILVLAPKSSTISASVHTELMVRSLRMKMSRPPTTKYLISFVK